jgi:hypothetical protein
LVRPDKPRRHCERSGALVARLAGKRAVLVCAWLASDDVRRQDRCEFSSFETRSLCSKGCYTTSPTVAECPLLRVRDGQGDVAYRREAHIADRDDGRRRPGSRRACGRRSLFGESGLAQALEHRRQIRRMRDHPFNGEIGKDTSGFRQCGFRLVHLAFERVGGGEI